VAHLLVVDDQARFRRTLRMLLQSAGHMTDEAEDAPTGIELASHACYDVVITDLCMKRGSGLDLLAAVEASRVKVIVVTGLATDETREAAANLGAYAFFEKPVDIEVLLQAIGDAVESCPSESLQRRTWVSNRCA
jgi:two-component system, OmpR family, response regulator CpxR